MKLSTEQLKELRVLCNDSTAWASVLDELIATRELKGDQVPVAYCQTTRDKIKHVAMQALSHALKNKQLEMADIHALTMMLMPLFTAPQKPVVRFTPPINPAMFNADVMFGYNKARAEDKAAIEAAGGIVKDGE